MGKPVIDALDHLKEGIKATVSPPQIFEHLGFKYVGPFDGHDIPNLIWLLQLLGNVPHPVLLHIHTNKGQGADFAIAEPGRFHSPKPFHVNAGKATLQKGSGKSWTAAFAEAVTKLAEDDPRIIAMTAGMPDGTGLDRFAKAHPERYRDFGIAESATVDIAAGMARAGLKPIVAIYSTFLQRAFDQIFQEVVFQGLPVVFCLDRAGLVGGDGAVHHGFLDISYLCGFPNMVLLAPADENELTAGLRFALQQPGPVAIRYPRADVPESMGPAPAFELSKARIMRRGRDATILAYGATVSHALDAAELLATENISVRVVNARFAKPLDHKMLAAVLGADHPVVTVEDHSVVGGCGAAVLEAVQHLRLPTDRLVRLGMPADRFISHGTRAGQLAECGIDAAGIAAVVQRELEQPQAPHRHVARGERTTPLQPPSAHAKKQRA